MPSVCELLKQGRKSKGLTTREVSESLRIDQALVSKFENGQRRPTRKQIEALAQLFSLDTDTLVLAWLTEKILSEITEEPLGTQALQAALAQLAGETEETVPPQFRKLLEEMEALKAILGSKKD